MIRNDQKGFEKRIRCFFLQLNGLENKKPESGNPETMKKTETLAKTGGVLILMVGCTTHRKNKYNHVPIYTKHHQLHDALNVTSCWFTKPYKTLLNLIKRTQNVIKPY